MRHAHYLQHVPFEGLGSIEAWLLANAFTITVTRLFLDETPPEPDDIDLLIIMGGPMSVHDEVEHPWLITEKACIRRCIDRQIPILGICLGAQLLAECLGGRVVTGMHQEIGWFPIRSTEAGQAFFPKELLVFHWHGETIELPPQATLLANSEACHNQAFLFGDRILGLQCHLETTPEGALALVQNCGDELVEGPFIQTAKQIIETPTATHQQIQSIMMRLLDHLTGPATAANTADRK
jgi:GMP synthase-like glutamine amidotransferase